MSSGQQGVFIVPHVNKETTMVVDASSRIRVQSGGLIDGATATGSFLFAPGEIESSDLGANLRVGTIPLGGHLFAGRKLASAETLATGLAGQLLTTTGDPSIELTSSGDQSAYLNYASAIVVGLKLPPIALPRDFSTAGGLTLELLGESVGTGTASDAAAAFDIRAWAGLGDTEMGSSHPNFTSAPTWQGVTLASGDVLAPTTDIAATINVTLTPLAHAGRAFRVYDMRARYTRI